MPPQDKSGGAANEAAPSEPVRIRVKSRTGESYYRGPRSWPANAWARTEVSADDYELLRTDRWLDVVRLEADEAIEAVERSPSELLEEARREIVALRGELAALKEGSGRRPRG